MVQPRAFRLAVSASWRFSLLCLATLAIVGGPGIVLLGAMFGPPVAYSGFASIVLFPLSILVHEYGHALPAIRSIRLLHSRSGTDRVEAHGDWFSAEIRRPRFAPRRDALITMCGPAAGASVGVIVIGIALLCIEEPSPLALLFSVPFVSHLAALTPFSKDGRALLDAFQRKENT